MNKVLVKNDLEPVIPPSGNLNTTSFDLDEDLDYYNNNNIVHQRNALRDLEVVSWPRIHG